MLRRFNAGALTFTVTVDANDTNVLAARGNYEACDYLCFHTVEDAFTGTITLQGSIDGTNYATITEIGFGANGVIGDVAITAVDAVTVPYRGWTHMKLVSSGTEGDDATVNVIGLETYT